MDLNFEIVSSILLGIGLAISTGFRIFVPLLILGIGIYFQPEIVGENWKWLGSTTAIVTLGVATILEIVAYLIPWLDNLFDTVTVPLSIIAGILVMISTLTDLNPIFSWGLAILAGGGMAISTKGIMATARLGSTSTTGGIANPVFSSIETFVSFIISIISIIAPIFVLFVLIGIIYLMYKRFNKQKRIKH